MNERDAVISAVGDLKTGAPCQGHLLIFGGLSQIRPGDLAPIFPDQYFLRILKQQSLLLPEVKLWGEGAGVKQIRMNCWSPTRTQRDNCSGKVKKQK